MIGLQVFLTKTSLGRFATKSLELSGAMWSTGRTVSRLLTSKDNFLNLKHIYQQQRDHSFQGQVRDNQPVGVAGGLDHLRLQPQPPGANKISPSSSLLSLQEVSKRFDVNARCKPLHESPKNVFKETDPQVFVLKAPLRCTGSCYASSTELVAKRFALTTSSSAALSCRSQIRLERTTELYQGLLN